MEIAFIADVHANLFALRAVFDALDRRGTSRIVCAGDLVGYNSLPRETLACLRARSVECVHGNHDLMVAGIRPIVRVGPRAKRAATWSRTILSHHDRALLAQLPGALRWRPDGICVHGSIESCDTRLERAEQFRSRAAVLRALDPKLRVCVHGHTHIAHATYVSPEGDVETRRHAEVALDGDGIWFVNPGSVGEPHDVDARAAFATFDPSSRMMRFHRIAYDTAQVALANLSRLPPLEADTRFTSRLADGVRAAARALYSWA